MRRLIVLLLACGCGDGGSSTMMSDASTLPGMEDSGAPDSSNGDSGVADGGASLSDAQIPPLPPGPNRFDGDSEQEIFVAVREDLCAVIVRCPILVSDPPPTDYSLEECRGGFDDMSAYQDPISEEKRGRLAQCLDALEKAECNELLNQWPAVCGLVEEYTDLS